MKKKLLKKQARFMAGADFFNDNNNKMTSFEGGGWGTVNMIPSPEWREKDATIVHGILITHLTSQLTFHVLLGHNTQYIF